MPMKLAQSMSLLLNILRPITPFVMRSCYVNCSHTIVDRAVDRELHPISFISVVQHYGLVSM